MEKVEYRTVIKFPQALEDMLFSLSLSPPVSLILYVFRWTLLFAVGYSNPLHNSIFCCYHPLLYKSNLLLFCSSVFYTCIWTEDCSPGAFSCLDDCLVCRKLPSSFSPASRWLVCALNRWRWPCSWCTNARWQHIISWNFLVIEGFRLLVLLYAPNDRCLLGVGRIIDQIKDSLWRRSSLHFLPVNGYDYILVVLLIS